MSEKVTIYDIAEKLNITAATVSRALNNNPKIKEATRELVIKTAAAMNYKQNKLALALKSGRSNNIGVIVPRIDSNFFASVIRGIEEELYPHGYQVIICQTHESIKRENENLHTLVDAQVDGIMMSVTGISDENDSAFRNVLEKNVPLIFFDRSKHIDGVSSVTINDFKGGYLATKHLIDEGCRNIAHFSGDQSLDIFKNRFLGYKQALLDSGLDFKEEYVIYTKSSVDAGKESVDKLLQLQTPPDAIFSSSDFAALGAIQELKERNISIPSEFCVAGFSNEPFTKFMELSITSVDQSPLEMGRMSARVFLEQVDKTDAIKIEKKVVLAPELHIRKSSTRTNF
ncbi:MULTISPECIES: LacI family DNA-binding transcriptional regulator [Flavobacterium]|jgi:LacI family transcriptional regulator|uniref:HTH-type transcriptional regulator DegA n=1 Tax=Flavobacterium anhuiense TaxID=459526 RepID=A0AAC9D1N7_9FLAO|nr:MULTISPECIES: LacI family DNA-binding transcriptional regulator [Flavobacterium]AOC96316.1 HTH-type transcriptional regulator DegA [Flavobacterium anhuiense]EJG00217.1 LacI family transcriptional regulator [Flavobacterium sp. F52]MXO06618.1 substrate-binding domain-containing protein [Flavobacterium sp. HBTb2-11-1]URM36349.1 LacI family transcriptional regulator [Flavobacterium anhuiense]